jgi:hypothetical protein
MERSGNRETSSKIFWRRKGGEEKSPQRRRERRVNSFDKKKYFKLCDLCVSAVNIVLVAARLLH